MESEEFWLSLVQIVVAVVLAVVGWVTAHWFTSRREQKKTKREKRIEVLSGVYQTLVRSGIDGKVVDSLAGLPRGTSSVAIENAFPLIHLYGTEKEVELANQYVEQVAKTNHGNATDLINEIRKDVRKEMGLSDLKSIPYYLRVEWPRKAQNTKNETS